MLIVRTRFLSLGARLKSIDLNADLGEGQPFDLELMGIISSASIACGGHAGDIDTMAGALIAAKDAKIVTGAHPGFEDKENFGRVRLDMPIHQIVAQVERQLKTLLSISAEIGQTISYVKLHGAMYNWASKDEGFARELFIAIKDINSTLRIMALDNSAQVSAARSIGLETISEAFVDRAYDLEGFLVDRSISGAVFHQTEKAVFQALSIVERGQIISIDHTPISSNAQSLCLHGDNVAALTLARSVRDGLLAAGVTIQAPA